MRTDRKELALAKVLAGAAWADGEVTAAEAAYLERVGSELGLDAQEIGEIRRILAKPIGIVEIQSLAADFLAAVPPPDRAALIRRLGELFAVDGRVGETESHLLASLSDAAAPAADAPTLVGRMRGLLHGARRALPAGEPSGTGVLEKIRERVSAPRRDAADRDRFDRAVLFGAILYRVAFADGRVDPAELDELRALLTGPSGLPEDEADHVIAAVGSRAAEDLDRQRLCASFNRVSTMDERLRLLGCLFAVAKADGRIDASELEEIHLIANYLWIDARQFNEVRLRQEAGRGEHP